MEFKQKENDAKQRSAHSCTRLISYSLTCRRPHPVVDVSGKRTAEMRRTERNRIGMNSLIKLSMWSQDFYIYVHLSQTRNALATKTKAPVMSTVQYLPWKKKLLLCCLFDLLIFSAPLWNGVKTEYLFGNPNSVEGTENCMCSREWLNRSYRLALWIIMKTSVITFSFK